jgi:hypothetical protein
VEIRGPTVYDLHQQVSEIDIHDLPIGSKTAFQEREFVTGQKFVQKRLARRLDNAISCCR